MDAAANWDRERIREAERAVEKASSAVSKLGVVPIDHAWHGVQCGRLTPFDAARLEEALYESSRRANNLVAMARKAGMFLGAGNDVQSVVEIQSMARALQHLSRTPQDGREALGHSAWRSGTARVEQVLECGKVWSSGKAELTGYLVEDCWTLDLSPIRQALAHHGRSIFRVFFGSYRQAVADFRKMFRQRAPKKLKERLSFLDRLSTLQTARHKLQEDSE